MQRVIHFDGSKKVRRVQAVGHSLSYIFCLTFLDKEGNEIDSFNPMAQDSYKNGQIHEIGESEDLIGVYGQKDKDNKFSSFGFIVKVRQD